MRNRLDKHLASLKRNKYIKTWFDGRIEPGREWEKEVFRTLESADIILLLISADFISSDYCYDVEMDKAITKHEKGDAVVIPIILTHCDWSDTPFSKLQALPKDAIPIMDKRWDTEDLAMKDVALGIRAIVTRKLNEREESVKNYFQEITSLKDEKAQLETELKYSKQMLKDLEEKMKASPEIELIKKLETRDSKIRELEIANYELINSLNTEIGIRKNISKTKIQKAKILNTGQLYTTINETNSGEWINEEVKKKAGESEWQKSNFFPKENMVGEIISSFIHPVSKKLIYVLLVDNKYYVPIGVDGIKLL